MHEWVPAIIMLGGGVTSLPCDGLASHPGGSSNIPSCFMLRKPELSARLMGHFAHKQTITYLLSENTENQKHNRDLETGLKATMLATVI